MNKRIVLKIYGVVQGVFYRVKTVEIAKNLGLSGWVKNESDGTVKIVAEGDEQKLKELLAWCWKGPLYAKVENIKVRWEDYKDEFEGFEIRY